MPYLRPLDLNKGAILEDTSGVPHSQPIHVGAYSRSDERERLRSCYTMFHNYKCVPKNVMAHPRSMRLLAGTNEYAEDLTGQRAPLNASGWRSETKVEKYYFTIFYVFINDVIHLGRRDDVTP